MSATIRPLLALIAGIAVGIGGAIFLRPVFFSASSVTKENQVKSRVVTPPYLRKTEPSNDLRHLSAFGSIADVAKITLPPAGSDAFAKLVRELLADGNSSRRLARFQLLLEKFSPNHFRALLPLIRENDLTGVGSPDEWTLLWQYWGGSFPQDALAAMQSLDQSEWGPGAMEEAQKSIMHGWAAENPQEAMTYYKSLPESVFWCQPKETLEAIVKGWVSHDPERAAIWLAAYKGSLDKNLFRHVIDGIARQGGQGAVEALFSRQSGELKTGTLGDFAGAAAEQKLRLGLEAAKTWVERQAQEPWAQSGAATVSWHWAQDEPKAALEWAAAHHFKIGSMNAMDALIEKDAVEASQWLHDHPDAPIYDEAAGTLALRLKKDNPKVAEAWWNSIKDSDWKESFDERLHRTRE